MNIYEEVARLREITTETASTGVTSVNVADAASGTANLFLLNGALCSVDDEGRVQPVSGTDPTLHATYDIGPIVHGARLLNSSAGVTSTIVGVDASSQTVIIGTEITDPVGELSITPTADTLTFESTSASDTNVLIRYILKK